VAEAGWQQYEQRLLRVCDYIHDHLDDDLDMELLSQIACLSQYHWHRIYRAIFGETVTATIKRLRLNRAASDLVKYDIPLELIARQAKYPNIQSFNRTFKDYFGVPPGKFRSIGGSGALAVNSNPQSTSQYQTSIIEQETIHLAGFKYQGPYDKVGGVFERMNALAGARGLFNANSRVIGIYYDDPDGYSTSEGPRAFAGLTYAQEEEPEPPFETCVIPAGRFAVFHYQGPYANFEQCYQWIYTDWLRESPHSLRDAPGFADYLNPMQIRPNLLKTNIHIPIQ
jgi:AraC family transcriptional regulator